MFVVVIAGNIGAGKSTTLQALSDLLKDYNVCFVYEPVQEWRDKGYLEEFYKTGNAFEFQLRVLYSRIDAFENALAFHKATHDGLDPTVVIMDRWFFEDREFARVNLERGAMSASQFALYETAYDYLQKHYPAPNISIWLHVSPEACFERLKQRGRSEEVAGITLEYLQQLNMAQRYYNNILSGETLTPLEVALAVTKYILPYNVL
jgi:deoxyadenosine/deoxycytidine kinase